MKFFFALSLVAALAVLQTGCNKSDESEIVTPKKEDGSVSGTFYPFNSVEKVTATFYADPSKTYTTYPGVTDKFKIEDIPEGLYYLKLFPKPGYRITAAEIEVNVTPGYDNNTWSHGLEKTATFAFTEDNNQQTSPASGISTYREGNYLHITSGKTDFNWDGFVINFHLQNYTGPGVYQLNNAGLAKAFLYRDDDKWEAISGTLTITAHPGSENLINGNFAFEGGIPDYPSWNKTITDGQFTDLIIE